MLLPVWAGTGSARRSEDRILEQGLGLSWIWQGSHASFEVWRCLCNSREVTAEEEADWVGHAGRGAWPDPRPLVH
jgi:hypothetical protein